MTRRNLFKIAAAIVVLIAVVTAGTIYISHVNRRSAIDTTILWARLSPFPPQAHNLQVDIKGSIFTREFVISFEAASAVIRQWIASSRGPASGTPTMAGSTTTYAIAPGGGASFAELIFDSSTGHVVIHSYWS